MKPVSFETDGPVIKRIPQQSSQSSRDFHTLLSEIQYQNFNDFHLWQDIWTNIEYSSLFNFDKTFNTNAITPTLIEPTSTQSLPFVDPSFLLIVELLKTSSAHQILSWHYLFYFLYLHIIVIKISISFFTQSLINLFLYSFFH